MNITSKSTTKTNYYVNVINYTAQSNGMAFRKFTNPLSSNYLVLYMTSLWILGSFGWQVEFHVATTVLNETHYQWNATLWKNVMVTNVHFSMLVFNSDDVQSS